MATKKDKTVQKKESVSGKIMKSPKAKPGKTANGDRPQIVNPAMGPLSLSSYLLLKPCRPQ